MAGVLVWLEGVVRTPLLTDAALSITVFGSVTVAALVIYTLYHFGLRQEAVLSLAATVLAGLTALAGKTLISRPRPSVIDPLITTGVHTAAFPSGHTTLAFALATVLEQELDGANYYLYGLAAVVGVSRLYLGLHYPGDVVAGAAVGVVSGLLVHRYREHLLAAADRYI
ncbi:MAG: phosphatase PAP2 family protein [Candidatus Nanohaloarchaea archaeon]|nr:phosphatase PAP2 family protein [Candidatus Nanohaloarchaea archaeon]